MSEHSDYAVDLPPLAPAEDQVWLQLDGGNENGDLKNTVPVSDAALSEAQEPAADLVGRMLGKFRLEQVIARGGMGIIVRSSDMELDREVAIKLLLKRHRGKPHLHQQFTSESRITGRLQHPGVIPIYETGTSEDGRPFFAMKLVEGQTLAQLVAARKSVDDDLPKLLKIFEQVCQTLSYTHSNGVIHLDIKPANIMVGPFGEVHLMDWGLARISRQLCSPHGSDDMRTQVSYLQGTQRPPSHNTSAGARAGAVWGTPLYMAPEQARGECMDVRTDVFGLGALLCEILTGLPPYDGRSLVDVCVKAAQGDLDYAYSNLAGSQADGTLIRLAMKCLSVDPDNRPSDAGIVAQELTLYLESLLQRAQSDLERFFDLSLDLFCIAGMDGYFRRVNSNFPRVLGYTEKAIISRPFLELVHPDDRGRTVDVMSQLMEGQPVVQFQNRYLTASGSWRYFEWTAKSIPAEGIIFAVARDVTDRMR